MSHEIEVQDLDTCFIIDPYSRTITKESGSIDEVVQFDHNSERFTFKLPKIIDGHDMSTCDRIEIHYVNTGTGTSVSNRASNADFYTVDDLAVDPADAETLKFTWLLSQNGTQLAGTIKFQIHFKCYGDEDAGVTDYIWNTQIYSAINVREGLNCTELILEQNPDVIRQFEERLAAIEKVSVHSHDNKEVLDKFTEVDGVPLYDSKTIGEIPDGSITTEKLANGAVTASILADKSVYGQHIVNNSIGSEELAANSVDIPHIVKEAIITSKIAPAAVTPEKLDREYTEKKDFDFEIQCLTDAYNQLYDFDGQGTPMFMPYYIVTADDKGKFLRVNEAGEWAAEAVPIAEEAEF